MKSTRPYVVAVLLLVGAIALRAALDPLVGDKSPFIALVAAVAAMVWLGGYRPAVLVAVVGYIVSNYLFITPRGGLLVTTAQGVITSIAYVVTCAIIIVFGERMRRARSRLVASGQRLRDEARRKNEFLALLAHELRNPLAPMSNSLSLLRLADSQPMRDQAVKTIERQLEQMVRLIDDLLDVNRMTRGTLELRRQSLELAPAVSAVVSSTGPIFDGTEQSLTVHLPSEQIWIDADPVRFAQILTNVLLNASKFTPAHGTVTLAAERQGRDLVVTVKDNGVGIPHDKLESVFEMFSQVRSSRDEPQGGLGVGLTLVRHLVELHGGTITAGSEGAGRGSEFVIRLPIITETVASSGARPAAAPQEAGSRRRVLVVDDNRDGAESLAQLLELSGHETRLAYDGEDALDTAVKYRPDFILLDIGLPKMNGYEACRRIRDREGVKRAKIIALTGWGQEEDRRKSQEAGFDGHLVKPVDHKSLLRALESRDIPSRS